MIERFNQILVQVKRIISICFTCPTMIDSGRMLFIDNDTDPPNV